MIYTFSSISIVAAVVAAISSFALTANAVPSAAPHVHQRRGDGSVGVYGSTYPYSSGYPYGGFYSGGGAYPYGSFGYGYGIGFPFASSFTNAFNANSNFAHYNDDTMYVNDKDATTAKGNFNSYNNANVIG
ncbi:hypothetical protein H4R20_005525 [Coemansia guatemalensis]|uniref:Uncharacterized protein n=1 Tax=Coemansia guatemalensis TaxID=2761395 RepID=A0A9W8LR22_9FUNG|nr:hypothetical protein H4R20_005525 [Coemansia guatemalensis]